MYKLLAQLTWILFVFSGSTIAGIPDATHPDFTITEVPLGEKYRTMGISFLKDGRMALAVTDFIGGGEIPPMASTSAKVMLISGYSSNDSTEIKIEVIADTWLQLVGTTVANGKLYVSDRDGFYEINQLSRPADLTKNRTLITHWPVPDGTLKWNFSPSWHQFVFTPIFSKGFFYAPYSGSINTGGHSDAEATSSFSGAFLKWDLTGKLERYAGGFRSPNGANIDEATGEMFVCDNQGGWLPSSTFALMKPNKFYGHRQNPPYHPNWAESLPPELPTAWLPHGLVRQSPSQPVVIPNGKYAGDWLIGDVNNPGLVRVALDKVGDVYNGAVFFFSKGTGNAAINRLAWGPDGALYIGTLATILGNWPGESDSPLYRLMPNAKSKAFEMKAVHSLQDGLEIEFTQPVDVETVNLQAFEIVQWQYIRQAAYGQGRQPDQILAVSEVEISSDKLRVHLKIADLVMDRTIHIKHFGITSEGKDPWNDETWFTLNALSNRAWNPMTNSHNLTRKVPSPTGHVDFHLKNQSALLVSVTAAGPWQAVLVSPKGDVISRQKGSGTADIEINTLAHRGFYLLKVEMASGSVVKGVML